MSRWLFSMLVALAWGHLSYEAGVTVASATAAQWAIFLIGGLCCTICACAIHDVGAAWLRRHWRP